MTSPAAAQCPACGRSMPVAEASFCPFCGAAVSQAPKDADAEAAFAAARAQSDTVKKHAILRNAIMKHPDCLPLEEEMLHLGRLPERKARVLDFSVIKSYLLHMYRAPQEFSEEKRFEMRRELFGDPQLLRCLELAPNRDAFMVRYLARLADDYVKIFLLGDNRLMRTFMGFKLEARAGKLLAPTVAVMLTRIDEDGELGEDERRLLRDALKAAYLKVANADASYLNEALDAVRGEA